jgi:hypothetical protein
MFIGGARFDLPTAVEQLTLLWANALGIQENPGGRPRPRRGAAAVRSR